MNLSSIQAALQAAFPSVHISLERQQDVVVIRVRERQPNPDQLRGADLMFNPVPFDQFKEEVQIQHVRELVEKYLSDPLPVIGAGGYRQFSLNF